MQDFHHNLGRFLSPLATGAAGMALLSAAASIVPATAFLATYLLALSILAAGAAGWILGKRPLDVDREGEREPADRFSRELALHASSLALLVVFILLTLTELLAIPAAMGKFVVFSTFGRNFVAYYPVLMALLVCALTGAILLASRADVARPMGLRERRVAYTMAAATVVFEFVAVVGQAGLLSPVGLRPERAVFVLAAALVSLFFFLRAWLRMPSYAEVSEWLERNERLTRSGLLRRLIHAFLVAAGVFVLFGIVAATEIIPREFGIVGIGLATLMLIAATFNVGVSHVVPSLEMGMDNAQENRRKRRIVLSATSIGLSVLGVAIGLLTLFSALAQLAGVEVLRFLLDAYVGGYVFIYAAVLLALGAAVFIRTRVKSEVPYTPKLQALAIAGSTLSIVLVFFGVFVGSGLAEGSGIELENAVLVMGAAMLTLLLFVKSRTLLPSIASIIRDAVSTTEQADAGTAENIRTRMIVTYVAGLVFVLSAAGYVVGTQLGVVPSTGSSLGMDLGLFMYLLVGIVLLVMVVMRYLQSVSIDPTWGKKEQADIGKKRLTSDQVKRYLILGFSVGGAVVLFLIGLLIQFGAIATIGSMAVDIRFATDFFVFAILLGLGPYGLYQAREAKRIESIDAKFPEFLRDLAESQRAGMTLTEAVMTSSRGSYGMLTPEIRKMAVQIEWGVSFADALERFSQRVKTPLIGRTVSLVIEASNAGGNVVDVLTAAANDAREMQQIVKERQQSMSIYVMIIYIAFAVFVGVIAVLNAQFIPEVAKAVEKADGVSIGGLNFKKFDQQDFKTLFFHAAVIQGMGGGIVGGVMSKGKAVHGLRHSFILVLIAWVLFRLVIG